MNIDCEKIIEELDYSEEIFRSYFQKILILQVIKHIFMKCSLAKERIIYTDSFFKATTIMESVQNNSSNFDGLINKMVSKEPFINQ